MSTTINIELDEKLLRQLVINHLREQLGSISLKEEDVSIQVKSKQNYKSEWEEAAFKATCSSYHET
jgi:hypothetical protein